jgi:hypothetical protein
MVIQNKQPKNKSNLLHYLTIERIIENHRLDRMIVDNLNSHLQVKNKGNLIEIKAFFLAILMRRKNELEFEYGSTPNDDVFKPEFAD